MPTLSDARAYQSAATSASNMAAQYVEKVVSSVLEEHEGVDDTLVSALESVVTAAVEKYGTIAYAAAAEYFEAMASAKGFSWVARLWGGSDEAESERVARYIASVAEESGAEEAAAAAGAAVGKRVLNVARDTVIESAIKYNGAGRRRVRWAVKFARMPSGEHTCPWCVMLASRGFVYASRETAGELSKWHDHCDCVIVSEIDDGASGGEISRYLKQFGDQYNRAKAAVGRYDENEILNYIYRENYHLIREERNERRRELYAKRKKPGD